MAMPFDKAGKVCFSPDSRKLLVWCTGWKWSKTRVDPGRFYVVDVEDMGLRYVGEMPLPMAVEWISADVILVAMQPAELWRWNVKTGERVKIWEMD